MGNIIIVDNKAYIRNKIKELLLEYKINVYEAVSYMQLSTILAQLNYDVDLIILEINLGNESGLEIISKLKSKGINIPILILTTENRKKQFVKGMKAGVIDYMLKPFNDKEIVERIIENVQEGKFKLAHRKAISEGKKVSLSSIKSAVTNSSAQEVNKEESKISIVMITFFKQVEEFTGTLEKEYKALVDILYPKLKEVLKGSELLNQYGFQSFIAAFKNIDKKDEKLIEENVRALFKDLKENNNSKFQQYYLECIFVNYPKDGKTKEELILKARQETVERINAIKRLEKK